jgi:Tfp pilus assembly protein PilO
MKFLVPLICLGIAGALFFGFIDPTYTHLKALQVEESSYDQALTRSKDLQTVRDQLLARYNTFSQNDLARLEKLIPDHVDNVRLILDLDAMASRYGMHVKSVSIKADPTATARGQIGPNDQAYESVVLSFSVSGSYDTFRSYLADLEKSLRLVDVVGLAFSANQTGFYDYTLNVQTYWLKP